MTTGSDNVRGKTVVIVGASSGFGRGTAIKLGSLRANVVIAARRAELLQEIEQEITGSGGSALAVPVDVSDSQAIQRLKQEAVARYGSIDNWINNVGVGALGFFWDIPIEHHARLIEVNFTGLVYGAHAALVLFRKQGYGTLINTGSIDSEVPLAYQASYAATKAAVLSLSRSLNEELRLNKLDDRIKVATIMPWAVDTPWWTHAANYTKRQPRMAAMDDPELIVDAIVAACSNPREEMPVGPKARASYISHQIFADLTERLSADIAHREVGKAWGAQDTAGSLHQPMAEGRDMDGGIRRRMKEEDASRIE